MLIRLTVFLVLSATLGGCFGSSSNNPLLDQATEFTTADNRTVLVIGAPMLQVQSADSQWGQEVSSIVQASVDDGPLPAQPGGGTEHTVEFANLSFAVRLANFLPGEEMRLAVFAWDFAPRAMNETVAALMPIMDALPVYDGGQEVTIDVAGPGVWMVYAIVGSSDDAVYLVNPAAVSIAASITMEGTVWPLRPTLTPAPAGYNGMRDTIFFTTGTTPVLIDAGTSWNGDLTDLGTDVDLGFVTSSGENVLCVGAGGSATPFVPYSPEQAAETSAWTNDGGSIASAGTWGVMVGGMPDGCVSSSWYYHNLGPVPYFVEIAIF